MDADTDDLRRQILEAALHDPQGLERALELAERAYGWLAPAQVPRALPAPAPTPVGPAAERSGTTPDLPRQLAAAEIPPAPPHDDRAGGAWSEDEDELLRQLYPTRAPMAEITGALPGRSAAAIRYRATKVFGLARPRGDAPAAEELPIVATARKAAEWLAEQGIAEIEEGEHGIFWHHDPRATGDADGDAAQLTPRQVVRLADSERGRRGLQMFGDGADLVGGPHQSSLGGII